jgi:hypothetical protein
VPRLHRLRGNAEQEGQDQEREQPAMDEGSGWGLRCPQGMHHVNGTRILVGRRPAIDIIAIHKGPSSAHGRSATEKNARPPLRAGSRYAIFSLVVHILRVKYDVQSVNILGLAAMASRLTSRPHLRRRGRVSARKRAANRRNARRSTGPRTAAGKARSARNGRRHGLTLPVSADPASLRLIMTLTDAIAGPGASAECREAATRFALAQADLVRIRRVKTDLLVADLASRPCLSSPTIKRLASLMRYEQRACARRKVAARQFDRASLANLRQDEPTSGNSPDGSTGLALFSRPGQTPAVAGRSSRCASWPKRTHRTGMSSPLKRLMPKSAAREGQRAGMADDDRACFGQRMRPDLAERGAGLVAQEVDDVARAVAAERAEAP